MGETDNGSYCPHQTQSRTMMMIIMMYLYCLFSGLCINAISSPDLQHKLHLMRERERGGGARKREGRYSNNNNIVHTYTSLPAVVFTTRNNLIMYAYSA